jgi:phage portal protein BeeE
MWSDGERWGPNGLSTTIRGSSPSRRSTAPSRSWRRWSTSSPAASLRCRSTPTGGKDNDEREVVKGDALDALINKPLPGTSAVWLNHQIAQSLLVHGNALVAKLRNAEDEPPFGLLPLDWGFVSAFAPMGGRVEQWATRQFGDERIIDPADALHFAWGAPSGQIGVSPLEKLGVTIRLEDAAQRHQTGDVPQRVRPSLAVRSTTRTRRRSPRLRPRSGRGDAQGAGQLGPTFFMGANVKLQPLSLTPVEAR